MWTSGSQDTTINVFFYFYQPKIVKKTHFSQEEMAQIQANHLRLISIAIETSTSPTVIPCTKADVHREPQYFNKAQPKVILYITMLYIDFKKTSLTISIVSVA